MTFDKLTKTNPLLYNITIKISKELSDSWLNAMKEDFLPQCTDGKIIVSSQINKLLLEEEDGEDTYAVQFIFASKAIYDSDGLPALGKFLSLLDSRFMKKYVYFTTKMEILHYIVKPSDN